MERRVDYTVVGIFVVFLTVLFVSFFFWLSTKQSDRVYHTYQIYTSEDITGLAIQSPVRFNGVPVGFVSSIDLDKKNPQLVLVTLQVQEGTPVTTATYASFNIQGITGSIYVGLKVADKSAPNLVAAPGQPYPVISVRRSILSQISKVVPTITNSISNAGTSIQQLLSVKNREAVASSLQNLKTFTHALSQSSVLLSKSVTELHYTLHQSSMASQDLPKVMKQLQQSLHEISSAAKNVKLTSRSVTKVANSGNVLLGSVNQQTLPQLQQSLSQLTQIMGNLKQLTTQLQRNPSELVRGRSRESLGPGEK